MFSSPSQVSNQFVTASSKMLIQVGGSILAEDGGKGKKKRLGQPFSR
jgi:hypothetical protein